MRIKVEHKKLIFSFIMRDKFPLLINRMSYPAINFLSKILYFAFETKILQKPFTTTNKSHFAKHMKIWYLECLSRLILLFLKKHWIKYMIGIFKQSRTFAIFLKCIFTISINNFDSFLQSTTPVFSFYGCSHNHLWDGRMLAESDHKVQSGHSQA